MKECCKKYKQYRYCPDCGFKIETDPDKCPTCNDKGIYSEGMGYGKYAVVCEACFGTGVKQKCNSCGGN